MSDHLVIGTNGCVAAIDKTSGRELWRTKLGTGFFSATSYEDVSVIMEGRMVFAGCNGHLFGLEHCIHYRCGMNGTNNPTEAALTPIHLCPICLRKLQYSTCFNVTDRYNKLQKFYKRAGMDTEADWVEQRMKSIQTP